MEGVVSVYAQVTRQRTPNTQRPKQDCCIVKSPVSSVCIGGGLARYIVDVRD